MVEKRGYRMVRVAGATTQDVVGGFGDIAGRSGQLPAAGIEQRALITVDGREFSGHAFSSSLELVSSCGGLRLLGWTNNSVAAGVAGGLSDWL
ncbi:hypothetical protein [Streptomyces jeddahensis]|uniref:hypothetical protein n=1 Tax=Streptomyces jeddahensis TaxID=1716141 RepID=UPI0012FF7E14|nr:hypothetical protein [Streptomyces jeddahensis]